LAASDRKEAAREALRGKPEGDDAWSPRHAAKHDIPVSSKAPGRSAGLERKVAIEGERKSADLLSRRQLENA